MGTYGGNEMKLEKIMARNFGFREAVNFYSSNCIEDDFPCIGADDNRTVLVEMFNKCQDSIAMIVDSLSGEISDRPDYYDAMRQCIKEGREVEVLFLNPKGPERNSPILELFRANSDLVHMYQANEDTVNLLGDQFTHDGVICNCTIVDHDKFRLETNTKLFISKFSFNNVKENKQLRNIFNAAVKKASPIF